MCMKSKMQSLRLYLTHILLPIVALILTPHNSVKDNIYPNHLIFNLIEFKCHKLLNITYVLIILSLVIGFYFRIDIASFARCILSCLLIALCLSDRLNGLTL